MPLNVRRFCTSVLLIFSFSVLASAQTSGDVMRDRIAKAKAFIAVRNYNAAIYELENIRRETNDPTVGGVINVLLMNSYLDQSDYRRAQEFLKELAAPQKANKQTNAANYLSVAGQVVKGARNQLERYKALGLSVSDRNLPLEALTDVEKMRETLEIVVEQSKVLGKDKNQASNAMALLEEATNARGSLARDDFDAKRWKDSVGDAREMLANSRSVIVNAVDGTTTSASNTNAAAVQTTNQNISAATKPVETPVFQPVPNSSVNNSNIQTAKVNGSKPINQETTQVEKPVANVNKTDETKKPEPKNSDNNVAENSSTTSRNRRAETENNNGRNEESTAGNKSANDSAAPVAVGSLIEYATQKTNPIYPPTARTMRLTGVVKVELVVDEKGQVADVQTTTGPSMLRAAASDAVKRWKFKPFKRDGQPAKAMGFVNFNFSL